MKGNKRIKRAVITLLILVAGFFLCNFLYALFDFIFNGFVREWIDLRYVYHEWVPVEGAQLEGYYTTTIRWSRVKELIFEIFLWGVLLLALVIRLVSVAYASWREKRLIRDTGRMMADFMRHDREASEVFPPEYAEVSLQMAQIKASVQHNEQMLRDEAARKNDLITYLAHDLKTPLTSVVGYLSLLEEAPDMPSKQKEKYIHITLDKALRLEKLINEFFEITRYNLQQIVLEKETVNLSFLLEQMTDEFYPLLSAHGNTILLEAGQNSPDNAITFYGDVEKLARVFNNILKNAIAYSYPDTEIYVGCKKEENGVRIVFSNRGKTIPKHKLDAIFEKFFRLDDARASNTGGAGLGLAIAKEIVTLHGGTIAARSEDEVTTFQVDLPLQA